MSVLLCNNMLVAYNLMPIFIVLAVTAIFLSQRRLFLSFVCEVLSDEVDPPVLAHECQRGCAVSGSLRTDGTVLSSNTRWNTHTHSHTHTHTHTHIHTHSHTHTHTLSLSLTHTHTHTRARAHTHAQPRTTHADSQHSRHLSREDSCL